MGNLFSCFHSKKSKHFNNRQIDNFDTSTESRSPIDPALYIERQKTDEILAESSVPEIRNHELHIGNSGAIATSSTRKSTILSNGANNVHEVHSGTAAKDPNYQVSDNTVNALFEKYKDEHEDAILMEGIERLCEDLNYKPDDFAILVLAWRLDASQMCRFTKSEFIQGLHSLNADTVDGIRMRLEQTIEKLKVNAEMFKQLYRFTFRFGLEPDNRIVLLDMAIILWRLVFTVHKPDILDRWLDYLELHTNIRGIPKDTWNMFLNFAETCDITAYDDTEAWPSLFDDFVEYENDRLNQNLTVMPDTNIDGTKKETQISVDIMPSSPQNL
ncbi:DCN1-like protein 3 [Contarinia nasturtii]|uniref:DCN1-like protein 3 n=1 Tax=Contarinia nasturtii TaxID=265458 RepID=UPI0012D3BB2B|nr:DCN1-like protein 3 [Contarinia nasturtii]XP_031617877.1 DCN1-like protein 3 [Contarinia nasturtii]